MRVHRGANAVIVTRQMAKCARLGEAGEPCCPGCVDIRRAGRLPAAPPLTPARSISAATWVFKVFNTHSHHLFERCLVGMTFLCNCGGCRLDLSHHATFETRGLHRTRVFEMDGVRSVDALHFQTHHTPKKICTPSPAQKQTPHQNTCRETRMGYLCSSIETTTTACVQNHSRSARPSNAKVAQPDKVSTEAGECAHTVSSLPATPPSDVTTVSGQPHASIVHFLASL